MYLYKTRHVKIHFGYYTEHQLGISQILLPKAINVVASEVEIPKERLVPPMKDILKLQGHGNKGKLVAQRCKMYHVIEGQGVSYGPGLDGWGPTQSKADILRAIWDPMTTIAHGFSGSQLILNEGGRIDGMIISQSDLYIKIKSAGGLTQDVAVNKVKRIRKARNGLMFYPETLGLTQAQDSADLVEYLHTLKQ